MTKATLPHTRENPLSSNGLFVFSWYQYFHDLYLRTGGGLNAILGGLLNANVTPIGNVLGGEDDLITYTLKSNTLANVGDSIAIEAFGTTAANANNKTIKLKIGSTTLFNTGAVAFNNDDWFLRATITRVSETSQNCITSFYGDMTLVTSSCDFVAATEDLSTDLTIKCTGTGTATNDISQKGMNIYINALAR